MLPKAAVHTVARALVPWAPGAPVRSTLNSSKATNPKVKTDLFEGINTTWTRVPGGAPIGVILAAVQAKFRFDNPVASVPELVKAYQLIEKLPDGYWKRVKLVEIKDVIKACLGLYHETAAADFSAAPGDEMTIRTEVINRSPAMVVLDKVSIDPIGLDTVFNKPLANNQGLIWPRKVRLNKDMAYTSAYWLTDSGTTGMYAVKEQQMRGKPETQRAFKARYHYKIAGIPIVYEADIVYRDADPAKGEIYRPFEIIPPVFTKVTEKVLVFADNDAKAVSVQVKAGKGNISGTLKLGVPTGWKVEPAEASFQHCQKRRRKEHQNLWSRLHQGPVKEKFIQ